VTFVAAAGDSGTASGVLWPASSPNVISVGGTSLQVQDSSGTYLSEGPWRGFRGGTSGGFSQIEPEPAYQEVAQQSGARSGPDVGYNADPNTGFAVYDSVSFNGQSGWDVVGGTSAGAPQWAALIALADQARVSSGSGTLDGPTQTLPALYSVYSAPGTTGYSTYTSYFNDIGNDGYGYTTGLGTPKAAQVFNLLVGSSSSSGGGSSSGSGTGGSSAPVALPPSPLTGTFVGSLPAATIGGSNGVVRLRLTNTDATKFTGPVTITLSASTSATASTGNPTITVTSLSKVTLKAGAAKTFSVKSQFPTTLTDGSYYLDASITADGTNTAAAEVTTAAPMIISAPRVDLATSFAASGAITVHPGKGSNAVIDISNLGNVTAAGTIDLQLYASPTGGLDSSSILIGTATARKVNLRAGRSTKFSVHFIAPSSIAGGAYSLLASLSSATQPADNNAANDIATLATRAVG
jgi:hypothetical protein